MVRLMMLCVAGDVHGAIDVLFVDILAFERQLGVTFDYVLQVGDFGVYPGSPLFGEAESQGAGVGDFPTWLALRRPAPRRTVFIKGNNEDFAWLDAQVSLEILPGLHYLRNGRVLELVAGTERLRVGGVGGSYSSVHFGRGSGPLKGRARQHYTKDDVVRLTAQGGLDIVLTHDAPAGVRFPRHRRGDGFVSAAEGLDELLATTRPCVCFFGHHHIRLDSQVAGVPCVGLGKVSQVGSLIAVEIRPDETGWRNLGEWPSSGRLGSDADALHRS